MRQFVNEFYHHNVHKRLIKKEVLWELPFLIEIWVINIGIL